MAPILYQTRIVRCLFVVRKGRIIDTGICIPLSNWTISHISPPSCEWEYATIMPPDLGGHEILPEGPVRRILQRPGKFGNWMFGQEIRSSNDTGQNYYRGANLATAFSDVAAALSTRFMGELNIHSFSDILLFLAPRYANAATALDGIIAELDASRLEEPDPDLDVLRNEFANLKSALQQIATQFGSGISTDPLMFDQARGALQNFATIVQNQSPVSRFQHASEHIMRLADGYRLCRDMVIAGLESTPNQDNFLAGILNRVEDATTHIAASISAHVQLRLLPSSPRGWLPNMLDGAEVFIEDADTGEDLDSTLLPVSGIGTIEIPISWIGLNRHVKIGVKLDTYLSTSFDVLTTDGLTLSGPLVNGDVDGNDQIDTADLAFVNSHLGEGGLDVPEISEADINYSGRVDFDDLNQVAGNMGQIGTGHRSIEGTVILQDWDGALQGQEVHVELLSPSGVVVLDDKTAMIAEDGKYSVQTFRTGLVQVRVSRTGFLARKIDAVIGPGSVSGLLTSLINGDCMPDNEINLADYSALALAFLSVPGDANWNGSADLNGDGEVNLADYAILSRNFGLEGD